MSHCTPWFCEALQCHNAPMVSGGSTVSPWPPWLCSITMEHWFHVASQCHMRPFSGTMYFWFHEVSQCHNGLFGCAVSQGTIGSVWPHSVKMDFGSMSSHGVKRPLCSLRFHSVTVDSLVPAITKSPKYQNKNP